MFKNLCVIILFYSSLISMQSFVQAQDKSAKPTVPSQKDKKKPKVKKLIIEGTMTIKRMDVIIKRLDKNVKSLRKGVWNFTIEKLPVIIVTDIKNNRMRILVPVRKANELSVEQLKRIMQANFDTTLDSRYAIAKNILWATYIHSLSTLHERQFISGIGQTVNTARTFGTTYSSGALVFQGGDSRGIIQRQLIEKLLKKGLPI